MSDGDFEDNHAFVRKAVAAGEGADFFARDGIPADAAHMPKPRIKASFLRGLMLGLDRDKDGMETKLLLPGVRIKGAFLDGALDLSDCTGAGGAGLAALALDFCDLPSRIDLSGARVARLSLRDSRFRELWGVGLKVDGDFDFTRAAPAAAAIGGDGTVYMRMRAARIGGDVYGRGSEFNPPSPWPAAFTTPGDQSVLYFQALQVEGNLLLDNGFLAQGTVWLLGARIGGTLSCGGGRFFDKNDRALIVENAEIGGSAYLRAENHGRFEAKGLVSFLSTKIGGALDCIGARFANENGDALVAAYANIGGNVDLHASENHHFEATGQVSLLGTRVGGTLNCQGARIVDASGWALTVVNADIGGDVLMRTSESEAGGKQHFEAEGVVTFNGTKIGRNLELTNAVLKSSYWALVLDTARVEGQLLAKDNTIDGAVSLQGARIGRLADDPDTGWKGAHEIDLNEISLDLIGVANGTAGSLWRTRAAWLRRTSVKEVSTNHGGRKLRVRAGRFSNQPWRQVAAAFDRAGLHRDSRRIRREEQREGNRFRATWQQPFVWLFAEQMFGYGLSVTRAAITVVAVWLIGALGAQAMHARGAMVAAQPPGLAEAACENFQAPLYALDVMIPFIDLRQESTCEPGLAPNAPAAAKPVSLTLLPAVTLGPMHTPALSLDEVGLWSWAKVLYAIFGAAVLGFAILTWSGVFRPKAD